MPEVAFITIRTELSAKRSFKPADVLHEVAASSSSSGMLEVKGGTEALDPIFEANEGFWGQVDLDVMTAVFGDLVAWTKQKFMPISCSALLVATCLRTSKHFLIC